MTILITGASGFLGSHICEELLNKGHKIIALKRAQSNLWRCKSFKDKVHWLDCDNLNDSETAIINSKPEVLIHAAWGGVKAIDRDNWKEQEKNLTFLVTLLEIIKKTSVKKIIALGSQAEYGNFEGAVDENHLCNPNSAYGANKVSASVLLKSFAEINDMEWYWIRIFSVFGPREEKNWLIPATINNLLEDKKMNLTPCEQRYDYLYTKDFAAGILSIIKNSKNNSGIYNMSSGQSVQLNEILSFIENRLSPSEKLLKIGALAYRPNQVMHMQGMSDRFFEQFNFKPSYSIYEGLEETINYYINQREK